MSALDFLAGRFEAERPRLRRIAYRMLGTVNEVDDAVQDAWVRLSRTDDTAVDNLGNWLTTVVGRICVDMLRARRSRREECVGSWLPEPIVTIDEGPTPEDEALIADGVGLALFVVLETLTPAERLAFILHDMFAMPFGEIATIVDRSPDATRRLASRARRRVQTANARPDVELPEQQRVVDAFFAAARGGDFSALVELLDPEAILRVHGGPGRPFARPPVVGRDAILAEVREWAGRTTALSGRPAVVKGAAGRVIGRPGDSFFAVVGFTVANGRITELDLSADPAKPARRTVQ